MNRRFLIHYQITIELRVFLYGNFFSRFSINKNHHGKFPLDHDFQDCTAPNMCKMRNSKKKSNTFQFDRYCLQLMDFLALNRYIHRNVTMKNMTQTVLVPLCSRKMLISFATQDLTVCAWREVMCCVRFLESIIVAIWQLCTRIWRADLLWINLFIRHLFTVSCYTRVFLKITPCLAALHSYECYQKMTARAGYSTPITKTTQQRFLISLESFMNEFFSYTFIFFGSNSDACCFIINTRFYNAMNDSIISVEILLDTQCAPRVG